MHIASSKNVLPSEPSVLRAMAPIMAIVLLSFAVIGMALPVLSLHVRERLGMGPFVVGMISGSQFMASLLCRPWAGGFADRRGGKLAVAIGLGAAAVAGVLYLTSLYLVHLPLVSAAVLLIGRGVLGGAESFIITGALGWGLGMASAQYTGRVIAWVGTAMFAAFAVGAPAGATLYERFGLGAVAVGTMVVPLLTLLVVALVRSGPPVASERNSPRAVLSAVWLPGLGLALSCTGFGAIVGFGSLLFVERSWSPVWPVFSSYAVAFILARVALGHLVDRFGGARVALAFLVIEAIGLALLGLGTTQSLALLGAALTGFGFSLVFPGFGVEAVKRVPAANRALAMGIYTAFLDLSLGLASPLMGWFGESAGLPMVFVGVAFAVLSATAIAIKLAVRQSA
ncbi:arabinose transporter [Pseudacidovorax sp. RU35E]|uniref:arabinose transporter n=1 Tax=Pseudacidovorax sp. RU35E TaxID=1907403 RepID=UPI000956DB70|nr:arabinose transporter [Pseudacidovorax sp. RU35E]SIR76130.1 Predicted arabinose efflux permease, MFS family [Pseudacidovorax sp. RU35E]